MKEVLPLPDGATILMNSLFLNSSSLPQISESFFLLSSKYRGNTLCISNCMIGKIDPENFNNYFAAGFTFYFIFSVSTFIESITSLLNAKWSLYAEATWSR